MKTLSENSTLAKKDLIEIRPYHPADENFIYATWLKGLRYGNEMLAMTDQDAFFKYYNLVIKMILERAKVEVRVACLKEDHDVILGYSVHEENMLHWVFTKSAWRKIGIANDLLHPLYERGFDRVTHITTVFKAILEENFPLHQFDEKDAWKSSIKFNPFL